MANVSIKEVMVVVTVMRKECGCDRRGNEGRAILAVWWVSQAAKETANGTRL